jgi:hypothetical protein
MRLERAIEEAKGLLADAAEGMIRMVLIRWTIGRGLDRLASPLKKNTKEVARVVFATEVLQETVSTISATG